MYSKVHLKVSSLNLTIDKKMLLEFSDQGGNKVLEFQ